MSPTRTLLAKELHQHRRALTGLTVLLVVTFQLVIVRAHADEDTLSLIQAAGSFVGVFVTLAAVVLGNRLVVGEYHARTQSFVESLPIRRHLPVAVKYLLGLTYLLTVSWLATLTAAALASRVEPVDSAFRLILLARVSVWVLFVWSFLFAMGFSGRLRATLYLLVLTSLVYLHLTSEVDFTEDGPLGLLHGRTFAFERTELPTVDLAVSLALAMALTAASFALALVRDGSVAESLAKPMSQREKATAGLLLIGIILGGSMLAELNEKPPYRFTDEEVLRSDTLPVSVLYLHDRFRDDARKLLDRTASSLAALRDALGIGDYPPIHVSIATELDPGVLQTAVLDLEDGVLVRANYHRLNQPDRHALDAWLVRAVLEHTTDGRARFEPKRWLSDGFALWWAVHGTTPGAETPRHLQLRAVVAGEAGIGARRVERWAATRESLGEPLAEALAYAGLRTLERHGGREAVMALARAVLGRSPPSDVRELLHEWRHPMPKVFAETTGLEWSTFLTLWTQWLDEHRARTPGLASIPRVAAHLEPVVGADGVRALHYRFEIEAEAPVSATCSLLHESLTPFEGDVPRARLRRVDTPCGNGVTEQERSGLYGPGEIALLVLEVDLGGPLGVPVRLHAERRVMP